MTVYSITSNLEIEATSKREEMGFVGLSQLQTLLLGPHPAVLYLLRDSIGDLRSRVWGANWRTYTLNCIDFNPSLILNLG